MADTTAKSKKSIERESAVPVSVEILTRDHEIVGLIYVPRFADENRRMSELLNDPDKRFLAVTDARMISRQGPATPRKVSFLQIHMDHILMLYPSAESIGRNVGTDSKETERLNKMRSKLSK